MKTGGILALMLCASFLAAQTETAKPQAKASATKAVAAKTDAAAAKKAAAAKQPAKITQEQADEMLSELRAIRQLLEKQQLALQQRPAAAPAPSGPPPVEKASLPYSSAWQSLGDDKAKIVMVEFADYQCPFCRQFNQTTYPQLKKDYVDSGKIRFVSRDLPLDFHNNAEKAAEAGRCAADQGKFWEYRDTLIANATDLAPDSLLKHAKTAGVDADKLKACLDAGTHKNDVAADSKAAADVQISGTPSFIIGKVVGDKIEGVRIVGAIPYSNFQSVIDGMLKAN